MSDMHKRSLNQGFTLIETMIAIAVLSIGVLSLAAVFSEGILSIASSQSDLIAKEKAAEAIESVFTSRATGVLTWNQIRNVSDGGIFKNGPQPLLDPGNDGLINTADDDTSKPDSIVTPGPDGLLGTSDDVVIPLSNFTREISITDRGVNLRQIVVTIRYTVGRLSLQYSLTTYISSFA